MRDKREALAALLRWLTVHEGFEPLRQVLPAGPATYAQGLFDACLARREGGDLRVHAFLADEGGDPSLATNRAEALGAALRKMEPAVLGRMKAAVWLVVPEAARAASLREGFLKFEDAHFLSKTLVGRGVLCMENSQGAFAGRSESVPDADAMAAVLGDRVPQLDPGVDEAERVRVQRESDALNRERDERNSARLLRPGPAPATWILIGVNVAVYGVQALLTAQGTRQGISPDVAASTVMLKLGANEPGLTLAQGQWWRLLASAFLHGGWWHLGMNMYALFLIGAVLERLAGPWRVLGLYVVAALFAGLLSVFTASAGSYSVGASGAIMGFIGVLLAPRFKKDPRFPEVLAKRLFQWLIRPVIFIFVLGIGLRLFDVPLLLDNAAHLGGLLSGFALGYLWPSFLVRSTRRLA